MEEFSELEGLPDSGGTVSDSDSSNDFLLCLPWVVSSRLQAAGNDVPKRATPSSRSSGFVWLLKWRMCGEDLAGGAEGGDSKSSRGEDRSQRAAAVAVAARPHPERHDGNVVMRQN